MPFGLGGSSSSSSSEVPSFQRRPLGLNYRRGQAQVGPAISNINALLPGFMNQVYSPAIASFAGLAQGGAPFLENQIQSGVQSLNENFTENILPALRRGSTARAGFGASSGTRGQLAEANAAGELLDAQAAFENNLRGDAFGTQLQGQLGALALSPQLLELLTGQALAPFSPLLAQANILGNPILEGSSSGSGFSFSI